MAGGLGGGRSPPGLQRSGHLCGARCGWSHTAGTAGGQLAGSWESCLSFPGFSTVFSLEKDEMIVLAFSYPI